MIDLKEILVECIRKECDLSDSQADFVMQSLILWIDERLKDLSEDGE